MVKRGNNKKLNKKLDLVLRLEKKHFKEEKEVADLERSQLERLRKEELKLDSIKKEEDQVRRLEEKQLIELAKLKELERDIAKNVGEHPLRKLTYKDAGRSMIGAFIGIVSHFTVLEGVHFAETVSVLKASFLLLVSFGIGLIMLYYTGFRKIKDVRILAILPLRLFLVYCITILAIIITLFVFGTIEHGNVYSQVAVLSLPAIIGACAAELIGGD